MLSLTLDPFWGRGLAKLIRRFTEHEVIILGGNSQSGGAKGFRIFSGGELTVIHQDKLVEDNCHRALQLRHEKGMHMEFETFARVLGIGKRMSHFARPQATGTEHDFTRVTNEGTILRDLAQLGPANVGAVLSV